MSAASFFLRLLGGIVLTTECPPSSVASFPYFKGENVCIFMFRIMKKGNICVQKQESVDKKFQLYTDCFETVLLLYSLDRIIRSRK